MRQIPADAGHATSLLDDMLLLARADAGKLAWPLDPLDFGGLLQEGCRQMNRIAAEKQIKFSWKAPDADTPVVVRGDAGMLRRLLFLFVDNAVKYTPSGGSVRVSLRREKASPEAILEVEDTGIGIAESDLPHIFDRFYRADKSRTSETGGAGLGLALAKEITRAHGGQIEVESTLGKGTRFRTRIPACTEKPATLPATAVSD